jgi:Zn-dependent protease/predicted transcriptional regulator
MFRGGFALGRLFGVQIYVDWGLSLLLVILTANLGVGLLPAWHPDWHPAVTWGLALAAALLFLASILVHELSHAIVGRRYGIPISSITLFIFGGAANMEEEPETPRAEFLMAGVGPLTSILLGVLCTAAAIPAVMAALREHSAAQAMSRIGPVATLLVWLGPTNVVLGVFNLLPAFPLDGGRLLRSALWVTTGDLQRATHWASRLGRVFAWLMIGLGAAMALGVRVPLLGSGFAQGAWLALIGWFLNSAAAGSYRRIVARELLRRLPVAKLMRLDVSTIGPDDDLERLAEVQARRGEQSSIPVVRGDQLMGVIDAKAATAVPRCDWRFAHVRDVMQGPEQLTCVAPDDDASVALERLTGENLDQMPVVKDGRLHGLLWRRDIVRWLELQLGEQAA